MRNHINGVQMDAVLLDSMLKDGNEVPRAAANRIRAEVVLIERALRSLTTRFVTPQLELQPAADLFILWKSRSGTATQNSTVEWRCEISNELIRVDMKVVADALCEVLPLGSSPSAVITADAPEGRVQFLIREKLEPGFPRAGLDSLPDGLEEVIARNGGSCTRAIDEEAGERLTRCGFPCESGDPPHPEFTAGFIG